MRNLKKVLSITAAAAMAVSTVTPVSVFADSEETFKIGVIGPMTGDYAQYGTGVYNAVKIAADEIIDGMLEKGIKDIDAMAVSAGMADQGVGKLIKDH